MPSTLQNLFDTSRYSNLIDKARARTVYGIASLMIVGAVIFIVLILLGGTGENLPQLNTYYSLIAAFGVVCAVSILLTRFGRLTLGAVVLVLMWFVGIGVSTAQTGNYGMASGMIILIQILLAGLLLRTAGLVFGTVLAVIMLGLGWNARETTTPPSDFSASAEVLPILIVTAIFLGVVYLYLRFLRLNREEGMNEALEGRLKLSEITAQITQRISSRMALNEVLNNAVEQVTANYPDIYHAQIFLVDNMAQKARLSASTGQVGKVLLERQHSLDVGSQSVIGRVTAQNIPIIARAIGAETVHRRNEFLPDTLVEAAFPLRIGTTVIGVLDLQSKLNSAFQDRDTPIFQTLADHIAIAIDNARLFDQTEQRLEENKRLIEQSRTALREVERLNRRLTGHAWSEYLRDNQEMALSVDFDDNLTQNAASWTPGLEEAVHNNRIIQQQESDHRVVAAPLRVRGQVIGAMEFELDEQDQLSAEDLQLVQEISERFGQAVETARLFDQSQRAAQREALINEIAVRLQASNNVETTLSEAAYSLKRTLKANKVSIRLGPPPAANGNQKEGGV